MFLLRGSLSSASGTNRWSLLGVSSRSAGCRLCGVLDDWSRCCRYQRTVCRCSSERNVCQVCVWRRTFCVLTGRDAFRVTPSLSQLDGGSWRSASALRYQSIAHDCRAVILTDEPTLSSPDYLLPLRSHISPPSALSQELWK